MKKLFMIMTLFASSFLFLGDVKAYDLAYDVDLTLLDDNFHTFKNTMDEFVKNDITYSDKYIICLSGANKDMYGIILPLDSTYNSDVYVWSTYLQLRILGSGSLPRVVPSSDYTSYTISGTFAWNQNSVYKGFIPLYANYDILMINDSKNSTVTYNYNDFTTINTSDGVDKFKTLYMINNEYQEFTGNADLVHKEELEKVSNFYTVVIDKLVYLSEVIVSNYIYLSIIVIFMLVFLFKLIFRRYL